MKKTIPFNASLVPTNAERVFEGIIFDVYHWQQVLFDGSTATFEMLKRPDSIQVICVDGGNILMLFEEQPHSGKRINLPCGRVDKKDKSILAAAKRELLEETGITCANWRLVDVEEPYLKTEWFIHTYIASGIESRISPANDPGEKILPQWLRLPDVMKLINDHKLDIDNSRKIFSTVSTIEELLDTPEFQGLRVDR